MWGSEPWAFPGLPARVVFGHGTVARAGEEVERLGRGRALVVCTPGQRVAGEALAARLGSLSAGVFPGAVMHTPAEATERAVVAYARAGADCVVALGGGSAVGLGKAVAARTGADQVAIPTTYAGSEMTDILGETEGGQKRTRRDPAVRPETVIYDVDLTLGLPLSVTVPSAMNALAHAVEALYAPDRSPVAAMLATAAVPAWRRALPRLAQAPGDAGARADALFAAWACGAALGLCAMGLHHKLAHVLGGGFGLPHAETHAVLLPHVLAFNEGTAAERLAPVAEAFGGAAGLWDWARAAGAPLRLADLGLAEGDLDRAAALAVATPYANPRAVGQGDVRGLLAAAWEGRRPETG